MPELAATIPSRPFPATAVGMCFLLLGVESMRKCARAGQSKGVRCGECSKSLYRPAIRRLSLHGGHSGHPDCRSRPLWHFATPASRDMLLFPVEGSPGMQPAASELSVMKEKTSHYERRT